MIRSDRRLTLLYGIGDFVTLIASFAGVVLFHKDHSLSNQDYLYMVTLVFAWILLTSKNKVYLLHLHNGLRYRLRNHLKTHFELIAVLSLLYLLLGIPANYTKSQFMLFLLGYPVINMITNYLLFTIIVRRLRLSGRNVRKALVVGAGRVGMHIETYFHQNPDFGYRIIGFLDDNPEDSELQYQIIGRITDMDKVLKERKVDEVIIALPTHLDEKIQLVVDKADYHGVRVRLVPDYFRLLGRNYKTTSFGDMPIINIREISLDRFRFASLKRICDVAFSVTALLMLAPLFLVLAILIKWESAGPVFYCPIRLGQGGRQFKLYKFRSMYQNDAAIAGKASTTKDDPRVTRIGRFIRKYSLDELPQFINVLLGDMSVVGPRPHRIFLNEMMQREVDNYMIRHYLKPGITGWAQVNGWRGPTDTEEQRNNRTAHDLWYVENWTPLLDIKIIFLTVFSEKTHKAAF